MVLDSNVYSDEDSSDGRLKVESRNDENGDAEIEWERLEKLADAATQHHENETAIAILERAVALSRRLDRADLQARAHLSLARVFGRLADIAAEIIHLCKAANGFQRAKLLEAAADTLLTLGQTYLKEGVTSRAFTTLDKALDLAHQNDLTSIESSVLQAKLAAQELRFNPTKETKLAEQLLDLARKVADSDLEATATERLERARLLSDGVLDDSKLAQVALKVDEADSFLLNMHLSMEGFALRELAYKLAGKGDLQGAIELCAESVELARRQQNPEIERVALENLGAFFLATGDTTGAKDAYEQMKQLASHLKDLQMCARSQLLLGNVEQLNGNVDRAETYFRSSLSTAERLADTELEALAHNGLGLAAVARGAHRKAIEHVRRGLELFPSAPGLETLAWLLATVGETETALSMAEESLQIVEKVEQGFERAGAHATRGFVLLCAGHWHEAEGSLRRSITEYEGLWKALDGAEALEIASRDFYSLPYELMQRVLIRQGKFEEALEVAEQARARAFAEALGQRRRNDGFLEAPTIAAIRSLAIESRATLVVYGILYDPMQLLLADRFGGKQAEHEETLLIWVVSLTGEVSFEEVDLKALRAGTDPKSLTRVISRCREALKTQGSGTALLTISHSKSTVDETLAELSALLVQPVARHLPRDEDLEDEAPRLVFVPQGPLFLVPFAALSAPDGHLLIERSTLSTAPSVGVLFGLQASPTLGRWSADEVLVVGDPIIPPAWRLSPLSGSRSEAEGVARRFGARPLVAKQATQNAIVTALPSRRLVHLATHGLWDYRKPGDIRQRHLPGALIFGSESGDGLLTAAEVAEMKLSADLVVLSACDTGHGRLTGDGVVGLSRAFLTAGAGRVVVSLWQIDDQATSFLMERFYDHLKMTCDEAAALRRAMLATREQFEEPASWAGFALIGAVGKSRL